MAITLGVSIGAKKEMGVGIRVLSRGIPNLGSIPWMNYTVYISLEKLIPLNLYIYCIHPHESIFFIR